MKNNKSVNTGKVICQSNDNFDWSLYEDGYSGGSSLVPNKQVKTKSKRDIVYSHEKYAQELYDLMESYSTTSVCTGKDVKAGSVYNIIDIRPVSDHEISVDSDNGTTLVVDLSKDRKYLESFGDITPERFIRAIRSQEGFKEDILSSGMRVKMVDKNRASIWEGNKSYLEEEFIEQYNSRSTRFAYKAHITSVNGGGCLAEIMGIKCFIPGAQLALGNISDPETLIGKDLMVMIVNYTYNNKCWVVSHKKYIEHILPNKVETELSIGMQINGKVTGKSKNGIFVSFQDKDGEWIYSGLCHRSVMSQELSNMFDNGRINIGNMIMLNITAINYVGGKPRIVLGDKPVATDVSTNVTE